MNLRKELLAASSRSQAEKVCKYIGDDPSRFAELIALMIEGEYRVVQRAARPVSICIERYPHLIAKYYPQLIKILENENANVAVKRNVVRLLQFVEIPKRFSGRIFDECYRLFADVSESIAVRVFAMTVAAKIAKNSQELMDELRTVAAMHPEKATAAMHSRVRRIFK